ncbi:MULTISPECIES: cupin domain-containing protein [Thioclava]|uniref:cupin domain-containing protein n=1 Tax=Thioclava TaxID=285107 RepID=UPI000C4A3B95|nr:MULTISPECIES: cupin domain-containing protein [Thioclava]MAQ37948.1 cupin [Thioclava sp.]|tara:strand:- start:85 stop:420 length:336 start_codon:yes stop_codon:yes gene_type:complete
MELPDFIQAFPALDLPFPEGQVRSHAIRSEAGLVVFLHFLTDFDLPPHAHKAQWGTVIEGEAELTIAGETRVYRPGETYNIPDGAEHSARLKAGTQVIDVFEEADRYPLKA